MRKRFVHYQLMLCTVVICGVLASSMFVNGQSQFTKTGNLNKALVVQDEARVPQPAIPCPWSPHIHQTAQGKATPNLLNFPKGPCSAGFEPNFGGTIPNRCFRHSFTWKPATECWQCMGGTLTIKYEALQGGQQGSSTSANDTVTIYSNGSAVTTQPLYSGTVTTGQVGTKTIQLKCEWLTKNECDFLIQDDTKVTSATLDVDYCCLRK